MTRLHESSHAFQSMAMQSILEVKTAFRTNVRALSAQMELAARETLLIESEVRSSRARLQVQALNLQSERDHLIENVEKLKTVVAADRGTLEELQARLLDAVPRSQLGVAHNDLRQLRLELESTRERVEELTSARAELQESSKKENTLLKKQLDLMAQDMQTQSNANAVLRAQLVSFQQQLQASKNEVERLQVVLESMVPQAAMLNTVSEITGLKSEIAALDAKMKQMVQSHLLEEARCLVPLLLRRSEKREDELRPEER